MKLYLDLCCLKRPFDDQGAVRVRVEAEAVLALQKAIEEGAQVFVRSIAHDLENAQNPDPVRRTRVDAWLAAHPLPALPAATVQERATELARGGHGSFDAFHLAWAEALGVEAFVTVDDRLMARASRAAPPLGVRVIGPVDLLKEMTP